MAHGKRADLLANRGKSYNARRPGNRGRFFLGLPRGAEEKLRTHRAERRAAERELRELLREDADPSLAAELEALIRDALAYVPSPWPLPGSPEALAIELEEEEERHWNQLEAAWEANDWEDWR